MKEKHAGGRPLTYKTKEELGTAIDSYFDNCEQRDRPPTIAGLAYWLDVDRRSIYNYEKRDEFFHTIKRARDKIIMNIEEELISKGNSGTIFLAKNYGYTDKQEVEHSGETTINNRHDVSHLSVKEIKELLGKE